MENTLLNGLKVRTNYDLTDNGAVAHKSTLSKVYDMFAFGGAYRRRSDADCVLLFKEAFEEHQELALKCLFYLRDIRGGQGERRIFRVCYKWLCDNYPEIARKNIDLVSEYGRWDDMFCMTETKLANDMYEAIRKQLSLDMDSRTPSLLGKWMPSENASSKETIKLANKIRERLGMSHKQYRIMLSELRRKINIVERLMSANRWDEIEFDKIPSKAGLIYKNAFARRDLIAKKYENFIKSEKTTVNAKTLYPYEVVAKALEHYSRWDPESLSSIDRQAIEKYWNNLPDYFKNDNGSSQMLCIVDTSGSMTCGGGASAPINIAIGLGMYAAERMEGAFKNHYISFASRPQLIEIRGIDFVDKVQRIYDTNLVDDTNLEAVFKLLKDMVLTGAAKASDLPKTIVVISDMQINQGTYGQWNENNAQTLMEGIRREWNAAGLEMPHLVYWNVDAKNNTILDLGPNVSYVSGASGVIFEQVVSGVRGIDLMIQKLMSERYSKVRV